MDFKPFYRWLRGGVPPANFADQAVARQAYADYLRAQIIGYGPEQASAMLGALTTHEADGIEQNSASFPELMGIETKLAGLLNDDLVKRTYWIVRERFNRVASTEAVAEHSKWAPPELVEAADKVPITPVADPAGNGAPLGAEEAATRHEQALDLAAADIGEAPAPDIPAPDLPPAEPTPAPDPDPASTDGASDSPGDDSLPVVDPQPEQK